MSERAKGRSSTSRARPGVGWLWAIRASAVLAQLARYFGQEIYSCIHYEEYSWYDDEWYGMVAC